MLRFLFGFKGESGNRMVVGQPVQVDVKEVQYILSSTNRLTVLLNLQNRYKGTAHEAKFRAVHEKSKRIHNYLVSKKRLHELELFHLQHTDHFINTFTVIMDVHQRHDTNSPVAPEPEPEPEKSEVREELRQVKEKPPKPAKYVSEMARKVREKSSGITSASDDLPVVVVPVVELDMYSSIVYARENSDIGLITKKIGLSSTEEEKEAFLNHLASRIGIGKDSLSYAGNAVLSVPARHGTVDTGTMPVINWVGFSYALSLTDYRLFPVNIAPKEL
ncbi:hypothetical protein ACMA1I_04415 [Pontibacter sp. 13R65]